MSTSTVLPDSFYLAFLQKAYPNNPEYHSLEKGLIKYAQDTYPADPKLHTAALAKNVIRCRANKDEVKGASKYSSYVKKQISQFLADEKVQVDLVVMDKLQPVTYMGCPTCTKKKCGEHGEATVQIFYYQFKFLDVEDGVSTIVGSIRGGENFEEIQPGDKIRVYGKVNRYKESLNLRIYEFQVLRRIKLDEVKSVDGMDKLISEIKQYTKIPEKMFQERMGQEGVKEEDLKNHVRLVKTPEGSYYELVV